MTWPLQSECPVYYGVPGKLASDPKWEAANLVAVPVPWLMYAAWNPALRIKTIRIHKKCADSLKRVLGAIWLGSAQSQIEIERIGMHLFGGSHTFRPSRTGTMLSMHAYGCAIDFDPARNALGDTTPAMAPLVVAAFEAEGWVWGGRWPKGTDGMHFQAARVR